MSTASPGDAIDELLERDGLYANLWSVQVGKSRPSPRSSSSERSTATTS
jgi:hypothetical protein